MDLGLYDMDLSLFGGDLLVGLPPTSAELKETKDVQKLTGSEITSVPWATDLPDFLGQDELANSTSLSTSAVDEPLDLPWMTSKVDLLDLIAQEGEHAYLQNKAVSDTIHKNGVPVLEDNIVAVTQSATEETNQLLVAAANDQSQPITPPPTAVAQAVDNLVQMEVEVEDNATSASVYHLLDMLATGMDPAVVDIMEPTVGDIQLTDTSDILSPVTAEDVESILSSEPSSPIPNSIQTASTSFIDELNTTSFDQNQPIGVSSQLPPDQSSSLLAQYLLGNIETPNSTTTTSSPVQPMSFGDTDLESITSGNLSSDDDPDYEPTSWRVSKTRDTPYARNSSKSKADGSKSKKSPENREARDLNRKLRKKQQNKDAATRYRQKKRQEAAVIDKECDELEARNNKLRDTVDQMTREIGYLKNLLAEVYKARGLLKPKALGK